MKIFSGDYSEEGYAYGVDAAKQHKPKNFRSVIKALHPISFIWNFDNAYNSFVEHYNHGYLDQLRVNHQIYHTTNTAGETMSTTANYAQQARSLEKSQKKLRAM